MDNLFRKYLPRLIALVLAFSLAATASADTGSQMDAYWSGALGTGSVTGPSAYSGQTMRYYSGGNLTMRTPQQNLQLFGFQPPSLSAGCGGIDIFAGGFSFVNSAQLVAFMKAVASNAEGYAFNAALGYLCPTCQKWLNDLQHMAQEINSTNISSCQAASALVNTAFNSLEAGAALALLGAGHQQRRLQRHGAGLGRVARTTPSATWPRGQPAQQFNPTSLNLAWQAIQKNSFLASDSTFAQTMMTITGTLITNCSGDGSGQCTLSNSPPIGDQKIADRRHAGRRDGHHHAVRRDQPVLEPDRPTTPPLYPRPAATSRGSRRCWTTWSSGSSRARP